MGLHTLVVETPGTRIRREGKRLVLRNGQSHRELPIEDVKALHIVTSGASISAEVIRVLSSSGAAISFHDSDGLPYAQLLGTSCWADAPLRLAQMEASLSCSGLEIAKAMLVGKVKNQKSNLAYWERGHKSKRLFLRARKSLEAIAWRIETLEGESGHQARVALMGMEAEAALRYWECIKQMTDPDLKFERRIRKGAKDPANRVFNYGYGILYSRVWALLARERLDPFVGFFHSMSRGRAALLFDAVEEFRPYFVDRPIMGWLGKGGLIGMKDDFLDAETRRKIALMVLNRMDEDASTKGDCPGKIMAGQVKKLALCIISKTPYTSHVW